MELLDGADAPLEPLAGMPEVAHDETLLPPEAKGPDEALTILYFGQFVIIRHSKIYTQNAFLF